MDLEILYQDYSIICINKPSGLLVHPTKIAAERSLFATTLLRELTGRKVYPVHRLDRPTSGLNLFAFSGEIAGKMQDQFRSREVRKSYRAIVRGWIPEPGIIDHPLQKGEKQQFQEAQTKYESLAQCEIELEVSRYPTSRYSLVEVEPLTGRMHQIRRHFAHFRHYVICDSKYGDKKHNKVFREKWGLDRLLLHAKELAFKHPLTMEKVELSTDYPDRFNKVFDLFDWQCLKEKEATES